MEFVICFPLHGAADLRGGVDVGVVGFILLAGYFPVQVDSVCAQFEVVVDLDCIDPLVHTNCSQIVFEEADNYHTDTFLVFLLLG